MNAGVPCGFQLSSAALCEPPCDQQIRVVYLLSTWTSPLHSLRTAAPSHKGFREPWETPQWVLLVTPAGAGRGQCDEVSLLPGGDSWG